MEGMAETLSTQDILDAGLDDWRELAQAIHTRFATRDFATGLRLVNAIGEAAEEANHHPDLDLRYGHLDVTLVSHDVGALTQRDVDMARRISALAAEAGVRARPEAVARVEMGLDTADRPAQLRFWSAVLGVDATSEDDIADSSQQLPTVWFQDTEPHEPPRQRWHPDVWVPHDQAQARIEAALAAGGTLVDDSPAPSFTILADPEGNKVCICTCLERT